MRKPIISYNNFASLIQDTSFYVAILLFITAILLNCTLSSSPTRVTDGSSSETVIGKIVKPDGEPAFNTQVKLIPENYNPVEGGDLPNSLIDTTNSLGEYAFKISDTGTYNIEAVHICKRTRLLITGIDVGRQTTVVPEGTLRDAGVINIIFPYYTVSSFDTVNGYAIIEGTTFYKSLSELTRLNKDIYYLRFDSIPAANVPGIHYVEVNNPDNPTLFTDTLDVYSNDTTVTEVFVFWANYTKENVGLPGNRIQDIYAHPDGTIWLATFNGVARLNGREKEACNLDNGCTLENTGLPSDTVYEITMDSDGLMWFATKGGAASYNGLEWTEYTVSNSGLPVNFVKNIAEDSKGSMWFGTVGGGVAKYDGSSWITYNTGNSGLPSVDINYLAIDNGDTVWVATDNGIAKFNGSTWIVYNELNSGIPVNKTLVIEIDRSGNKWFGHSNGTVTKFDGTNWTNFNSSNSTVLKDGFVNEIMEDYDGSIWIVTEYGLTEFNGATWTDYTGERHMFLEGKSKISFAIDGSDDKWIGTLQNGAIAFGPTIKVVL